MDVFSTVIISGTLILKFLGACSAYSDDAKSLKARFDWDLRALQAIRAYFDQRRTQDANGELAPDDAELLKRTADYLDDLVRKVQRSLGKIERKGLLHGAINRGIWIARQADLHEMEREVYDWTRRFDVRVLGLPPELRTLIPVTGSVKPTSIMRSNNRLRGFLKLASMDKTAQATEMRLEDSGELAAEITSLGDVSFMPLEYEDKQFIFASRPVPSAVRPRTSLFDKLDAEMGMLAAALNCLEPDADIRLLKVEKYFYHAESGQFLFAQTPPHPTLSMMTLRDAVCGDSFPEVEATLNQRLKLALKLAEAVLFLHSAGFVHKNITSLSVVALERLDPPPDTTPLAFSSIDDAYLMGFDLIRGIEARTSKEGAVREADEEPRLIWDFDLFQHPDRLQGIKSLRYTKTYDVYSLGVVLLEIGLWEPLSEAVPDLDEGDPLSWPGELKKVVSNLSPRTGERYQRLVAWCLAMDSSEIVQETEFVEQVLDPLEEMVNALS